MTFELKQAKNGELTAYCNNLYMHSSYSPTKEAENFSKTINCSYNPEIIFISEPGLSYIYFLLKKKFPSSKICAIRFTPEFTQFNSDWDYVINYFECQNNLVNTLISTFSEYTLSVSLFLQWNPSSRIFPDLDKSYWHEIKELYEQINTLLITRENFEQKWLINTINFLKFGNSFYSIKKNNLPVLIIASGPSLKDCLKIIKENSKKFLIICLSSALNVLVTNNIIPDFVLSTDGGFWAGEHLKPLLKTRTKLAITTESFVKKIYLKNLDIIPLMYDDGVSASILENIGINFLNAKRNGTVSGTALKFAMSISENNIYFAGLDLASQKGYQHTQINILEKNRLSVSKKINSIEKSSVASEYNDYSLKIYENWFKNVQINNRVYRIIDEKYRKNRLGQIVDISIDTFEQNISDYNQIDKNIFYSLNKKIEKQTLNDTYKLIFKISQDEEWYKQIYPLTYSAYIRNPDKIIFANKLKEKNTRLLKKIEKLLYE